MHLCQDDITNEPQRPSSDAVPSPCKQSSGLSVDSASGLHCDQRAIGQTFEPPIVSELQHQPSPVSVVPTARW